MNVKTVPNLLLSIIVCNILGSRKLENVLKSQNTKGAIQIICDTLGGEGGGGLAKMSHNNFYW